MKVTRNIGQFTTHGKKVTLVYDADESDLVAAMLTGLSDEDVFVYLPVLGQLGYVEFVRFEHSCIVFRVCKTITINTGNDSLSDIAPGTLIKIFKEDKEYFDLIVKWLSEE